MLALYLAFLDEGADENKFEDLYKKYKQFMVNVSFSFVNNYAIAEECVQEAFVHIAHFFYKIDDVDSERTKAYVYTIVRCISINTFNAESRRSHIPLEELDNVICDKSDCEDEFFRRVDMKLISDELTRLPEKYREPMVLRYAYDYSCNEIADVLKISSDNVRKRIQRAKRMLMDALKDMND